MENKKLSYLCGIMICAYVLGLGVYIAGLQVYLIPLVCFVVIGFLVGITGYKRRVITRSYGIPLILILFILYETFAANAFNNVSDVNYLVKMLILFIVPIILWMAFRNERNYETIAWFMVSAVAISSFVAIAQTVKMQWAIDIWYKRFGDSASYRFNEIYRSLRGGRSAGLSSYSLNLAFQIVQVFPLSLMLLKDKAGKKKIICAILSIMLFLGSVATGTRMATIICIVEFAWIIRPFKTMTRQSIWKLLLVVLFFVVVFYYLLTRTNIFSTLLERMGNADTGSVLVRWNTIVHYFSVWSGGTIINILFGFGHGTMDSYRGEGLGSGHNCIINMLFQFGFLGLCLGLTFYAKIFRRLMFFRQYHMAKVFLAGLTGYLLMSLTNDSGLLDGDVFHIYYISTVLGYVYTVLNGKKAKGNL